MEKLNELEKAILDRISLKYPILKEHIQYLKIKSREPTGVGMYINFCYDYNYIENIEQLDILNASLSTNEIIEIDTLENGLGYEVDITNGYINFIELITYGETWDGDLNNSFEITPI